MRSEMMIASATGGDRFRLEDIPATSSTTRVLVDRADVLFRKTTELHDSASGNRRDALLLDLEERTSERAKKNSTREALNALSDHGFAWRDVARILGVSVPSVNKWRKGDGITGPNRLKIARLLSLLDMLEAHLVSEPASWLEMPLRSGVALTPIELLAEGRYDLVLEYAGTHVGPGSTEAILTEFDPDWRKTRVDEMFETYFDNEGIVGIRPRITNR